LDLVRKHDKQTRVGLSPFVFKALCISSLFAVGDEVKRSADVELPFGPWFPPLLNSGSRVSVSISSSNVTLSTILDTVSSKASVHNFTVSGATTEFDVAAKSSGSELSQALAALQEATFSTDATILFASKSSVTSPESCQVPNQIATVINEDGVASEFTSEFVKLVISHGATLVSVNSLDNASAVPKALEFRVALQKAEDVFSFKKNAMALGGRFKTDVAVEADSVFRKNKRVVIFDMDSTLIKQEVIDEIARHAGVVDQVAVCFCLSYLCSPSYSKSIFSENYRVRYERRN
jgi:outer membrane protein OmpA-like peptidoglycan-associated protein